MSKQLGRALLVKIGDGVESEAFTTSAGLNSKSITVNNRAIYTTTPDATTPGGVLSGLWSKWFKACEHIWLCCFP